MPRSWEQKPHLARDKIIQPKPKPGLLTLDDRNRKFRAQLPAAPVPRWRSQGYRIRSSALTEGVALDPNVKVCVVLEQLIAVLARVS